MQGFLGQVDCDNFQSEFGCRVANSIATWLVIFLQLSVLGTSVVVLSSLGNSIYAEKDYKYRSLPSLFVAVAAITLAFLTPFFYQREFFFANTTRSDDPVGNFLGGLTLLLGFILVSFQFKVLLVIVIPENWYANSPVFRRFLVSGTARKECRTKKACRFKVSAMVQDALEMHSMSLPASSSSSSNRIASGTFAYGGALLAFESTRNDREEVGGILWAFKNMWNGKIFDEEGVWLHARLIASNLSQYFVAALFIILVPVVWVVWLEVLESEPEPPTVSPAPTIDPVATAAAEITPVVEYVFAIFAGTSNEVREYVWRNVNQTVTSEFTSDILNSLPNATLEDMIRSLDRSTQTAIRSLCDQMLAGAAMVGSRRLEDEENDLVEYLTPERWNFVFATIVASCGNFSRVLLDSIHMAAVIRVYHPSVP